MPYWIGIMLAVATAALARTVGFDRERAFYPTVLIVVASYYILFAAMGASGTTLFLESLAAGVFLTLAVIGYKKSPWLVAAAMAGHGVFDAVHHLLIANPGVPPWWPGFCMAFDVTLGAWMGMRMWRRAKRGLGLAPSRKGVSPLRGSEKFEDR